MPRVLRSGVVAGLQSRLQTAFSFIQAAQFDMHLAGRQPRQSRAERATPTSGEAASLPSEARPTASAASRPPSGEAARPTEREARGLVDVAETAQVLQQRRI